jgi:hypothetical protein
MNPGGSVKDRAALYVVKDAEEKGIPPCPGEREEEAEFRSD